MKSLQFLPVDEETEAKPRRRGRPSGKKNSAPPRSLNETPLAYMLKVMNDPTATQARRDKMAREALPYCHARKATDSVDRVRIKERRQEAAETAGHGSKWGNRLHIANGN